MRKTIFLFKFNSTVVDREIYEERLEECHPDSLLPVCGMLKAN